MSDYKSKSQMKRHLHLEYTKRLEEKDAEIAELKGQLHFTNNSWPHEKALHKEIAVLKARDAYTMLDRELNKDELAAQLKSLGLTPELVDAPRGEILTVLIWQAKNRDQHISRCLKLKAKLSKAREALSDLKVQFDKFSRHQWSQITQIPVDEDKFPRQDFIDFDKCFKALDEIGEE